MFAHITCMFVYEYFSLHLGLLVPVGCSAALDVAKRERGTLAGLSKLSDLACDPAGAGRGLRAKAARAWDRAASRDFLGCLRQRCPMVK